MCPSILIRLAQLLDTSRAKVEVDYVVIKYICIQENDQFMAWNSDVGICKRYVFLKLI